MLLCDCDKDMRPVVPESWKNFAEFQRRVLEPAAAEINKFTDLKVAYKIEKTGRKVTRIIFGMLEKTDRELLETQQVVSEALDGQLSIEDIAKEVHEDPLAQFEREHAIAVVAEQQLKAEQQAKIEASRRRLEESWGSK